MKERARFLIRAEDGQDLIEYALLAALIALASIGIIGSLTGGTQNIFSRVLAQLH